MECDMGKVKHDVLSFVANEIDGAVSDGNCIMFNWGRYSVKLVPDIARQKGPIEPVDRTEELKRRKEIGAVARLILTKSVTSVYAEPLEDVIVDKVIDDVMETADPKNWSDDDVRLALGRVLTEAFASMDAFSVD